MTPDRPAGENDEVEETLWPGRTAPIAMVPAGPHTASIAARWKPQGVQHYVEIFGA